jgi:hypothetical protein
MAPTSGNGNGLAAQLDQWIAETPDVIAMAAKFCGCLMHFERRE